MTMPFDNQEFRQDVVDTRNGLAPFIRVEQDLYRNGKKSKIEWERYLLSRMSGYGHAVTLTEAREMAARHVRIPPHIEAALRIALSALSDLTTLIDLELEHDDYRDEQD